MPASTITMRDDERVVSTILREPPRSTDTPVQLTGVLGEGGMGVVHAGRQVSLGRDVAVKMGRTNRTDTQQLLREAFVTSALEHPNIVPVYDLSRDASDQPQLVMKRVEGRTWDSVVQDHATRGGAAHEAWMEEQLRVFVQVCHAVEYAHSRGVIHRDLKPENVMIGDFGEVYVLDWGLGVSLRPEHAGRYPLARDIHGVCGTPAYMAPEQAHAEGAHIDERTDVYLLGAILHELFTGRPPHLFEDVRESLRHAAASAPPKFEASVPAPLAELCARALAAAPKDRFPSVAALRASVEDYLRHRVSIELAGGARRRLSDLRALVSVDAGPGQPRADARLLYKLFNEGRFALQKALEIWPENLAAAEALQEALELMVGEELSRGDVRQAELLFADLRSPNALLGARLEAVRASSAKRDAEVKELVKVGRNFDTRLGVDARLFIAIAFGLMFFLRPVIAGVLERAGLLEVTQVSELVGSIAFFALLGMVGWFARGKIFDTTLNRLSYGMLAAVGFGAFCMRLAGLALGTPPFQTQLAVQLLELMLLVCVALTVDKRMLVGAALYVVGFAVIVARPDWWLFVAGVSNALTVLVFVFAWWPEIRTARKA